MSNLHSQQRPSHGSNSNMSKNNTAGSNYIDAPYNFVPLADKVVTPDWADQVSHDLPFQDGLSGTIAVTLTAESPLLVGGTQQKATEREAGKVEPFKTPDGKYAIPGSSLKGMVRSVLEIATFSRMSMVDDSSFSVRDLTAPARKFYGDLMTKTTGAQCYSSKPLSGYLTLEGGEWRIRPCKYSRIEQDDLAHISGDQWWRAVPRCSAKDKYDQWGMRSFSIRFTPGQNTAHRHSCGYLEYSKADVCRNGTTKGTLVFTGQPARRDPKKPGKKHLEFVFYATETNTLEVPGDVMRAFLHIHRKKDGYKGEEWEFWKNKLEIPIFYLKDSKNNVSSLGLALMYKLAYKNSILQVINHTGNGVHSNDDKLDFATLLFGRIGEHPEDALKSRVWFELAHPIGGTVELDAPNKVVLSAPKPTYYPNYVCQDIGQSGNNTLQNATYKTYMDDDSEIRGWKRYPVRPKLTESTLGTDAVATILNPLKIGAQFSSCVVFHNLKPVELGALLWAMTWGGESGLRHALGMGKSLGYGQLSLTVDLENSQIAFNAENVKNNKIDIFQELMKEFTNYMQRPEQIPNWGKTSQIQILLGMADPNKAAKFKGNLQHMVLAQDDQKENKFVIAKKYKRVLAEYPRYIYNLSPAAPVTVPTAAAKENEVWRDKLLQYKPNTGVISVDNDTQRADNSSADKKKMLADLNLSKAAENRLKNGKLKANVTVKHRGGNIWDIINIEVI